ncbi:MAG: Lipoprotein releasing system ATP-binding protein LolD [uncultured Truepera sp.]|uniref:Lipoprotein releasing system ATP-binding protein LolD n=1 Tax=uncultured Truepera sp. TaxID=543023 RepID=A0A6J4VTY2_9DEIN|nr:MAG: Lipoprotein releasing system ATP-binding protein LolD [uncultured Truepera sp.]
MAGIVARGVGKHYPLAKTDKLALSNVDLNVQDGEFICLLGPSGCGKTTLLNILGGLEPASQGTVRFTGVGDPRRGYMFQEPRLLPWLSVRDNLRFVLDQRTRSEALDSWLKRVGLGGYGDYFPAQLSVGMQQRAAVARALITEPEVLFMDEPFSALDELTALRLRDELLGLWHERRCTVVFVTHNPLEAVYLADRVLVMSPSPGRITQEIRVGEHFPRPRELEDAALWRLSRGVVGLLMGEGALT